MKTALIVGKGISGTSAGELLKRKNWKVYFYDDKDPQPVPEKVDLVVKSPGVPPNHPLIKKFKKTTEVIGEVELAYRFSKGKIVGITGTNGKSTTCALIYHVLKRSGFDAFIGGNYGIPFSSFAEKTSENSIIVLELSSYQIEDLSGFTCEIGVIINVSQDHLDRYASFEEYANSKFKIRKHCKTLVVNQNLKEKVNADFCFSVGSKGCKFWCDGEAIYVNDKPIVKVGSLPLKGVHNLENYLSSLAVLSLLGVKVEDIVEGFATFAGLPHRMERVGVVKGVEFINDSKATNLDSMVKAVLSFEKPVILICGGVRKGIDFNPALKDLKGRIKTCFSIGESRDYFKNLFSKITEVKSCSSLEEAVRSAFRVAEPGDCVLFSPGCASFDMFKNYAERGNAFKEIVASLVREGGRK